MSARYANQVLLNTTAEEVYLDFSPGVVMDRAMGGAVLPIHTRIVMTPTGMLRLYQALAQALQNYQIVQTNPAPEPGTPQPVGQGAGGGGAGDAGGAGGSGGGALTGGSGAGSGGSGAGGGETAT